MRVISLLNELSSRIQSPFIIIGGLAVGARGFIRATGDVDIAVCRDDAASWKLNLEQLGYTTFHETSAFIQFKRPGLDGWPIDLMLVDQSTLQSLTSSSTVEPIGDEKAPVASIKHLIAMKLHALSTRPIHREARDLQDVSELLKIAGISTSEDEFRILCEKYGSLWVYEQLKK